MRVMKAGRELDALVAEKAIRLPKNLISIDGPIPAFMGGGMVREIDHYSTVLADAWDVVERLGEDVCDISIEKSGLNWTVTFAAVSATASTAPLAICLAALKFIGVDVTELRESSER